MKGLSVTDRTSAIAARIFVNLYWRRLIDLLSAYGLPGTSRRRRVSVDLFLAVGLSARCGVSHTSLMRMSAP
jgi:hypothetical protein